MIPVSGVERRNASVDLGFGNGRQRRHLGVLVRADMRVGGDVQARRHAETSGQGADPLQHLLRLLLRRQKPHALIDAQKGVV